MSVPKDKKTGVATESDTQKQKRKKEKLIRLDDLIPKGNVSGGRRLLFGATETEQPTQNKKRNS